ncbi:hypothetical protein ACOSQ2_008923 [Xanthoceras sorbifolium]
MFSPGLRILSPLIEFLPYICIIVKTRKVDSEMFIGLESSGTNRWAEKKAHRTYIKTGDNWSTSNQALVYL